VGAGGDTTPPGEVVELAEPLVLAEPEPEPGVADGVVGDVGGEALVLGLEGVLVLLVLVLGIF